MGIDVLTDQRRPRYRQIEMTGPEQVTLRIGEQIGMDLQRHPGQRPLQRLGDARKVGQRGGTGEADPQSCSMARRNHADLTHTRLDVLEESMCLTAQEFPRGGECDLAGGPGEQSSAELGLQLLDRLRKSGLSHT